MCEYTGASCTVPWWHVSESKFCRIPSISGTLNWILHWDSCPDSSFLSWTYHLQNSKWLRLTKERLRCRRAVEVALQWPDPSLQTISNRAQTISIQRFRVDSWNWKSTIWYKTNHKCKKPKTFYNHRIPSHHQCIVSRHRTLGWKFWPASQVDETCMKNKSGKIPHRRTTWFVLGSNWKLCTHTCTQTVQSQRFAKNNAQFIIWCGWRESRRKN